MSMPVDGVSMLCADSKNTGADRNSRIFTNSMIFLILIIGITISFLFYNKLSILEKKEITNRLQSHIEEHVYSLEHEIGVRSEALESIRGLYQASEFVSRDEFRIFSTQILRRHHDIIACEWLPQVTEDDRQKFEQTARSKGFKDFEITQLNDKEELVKAGKREIYFPILYVEPFKGHRKIVGFDVASNPIWKKLLDTSAAGDQLVATEPVNLVQSDHHKVIIIALPVFKDKPQILGKQKKSLLGFVAIIIDVNTVIANTIPAECNNKDIALKVMAGNEMIFQKKSSAPPEGEIVQYKQKIDIINSEWTIEAMTIARAFETFHRFQPIFVLISGIFFTLILALYINLLQKRSAAISMLVDQRTIELQKASSQLLHSEKLSAIGRLSASIAHEFNNPLYGVTNVLQGLRRRVSMTKQDGKLVDMAVQECDRMKKMIIDLQEFNRPTSGKFEPIDIHKPINHILLLGKKEFSNKGINIQKEFAEDLPKIRAIADQIKQVILNLVTNAVDACKEGDTVKIKTEILNKEMVAIVISDTGHGISEEDMEHIFEPFFTTKPEIKGTGLGLPVSYGIIKRHNGDLKVASELGKGSTFTLILPVEGT